MTRDIAVSAVNDAPTFTSATTATVVENTTTVMTVTGTDIEQGTALTYSIVGGDDQARFTIDANTGALTFKSGPNYESPTDAGSDNVYDVEVQVSDGSATTTQTIAVTVTDANDAPTGAPAISGTATQNATLTADTSGLADEDGLTAFTYQWKRDGVDIASATGSILCSGRKRRRPRHHGHSLLHRWSRHA